LSYYPPAHAEQLSSSVSGNTGYGSTEPSMVDRQGIPVPSIGYSNLSRGYADSTPGYSNPSGGYSQYPQSFTNAQSGFSLLVSNRETLLADLMKEWGTPSVLRQLQAVEHLHQNPPHIRRLRGHLGQRKSLIPVS
jgi:hypothetical protein